MKVLITKPIPAVGIEMIWNSGHEVTIIEENSILSKEELIEQSKQHDAIICVGGYKLDKNYLNECRHLKVIALFSVGYNNVDVEEATRLHIPVGNTPDVLSNATADTAFLLMLAASRKAFYMYQQILQNNWKDFHATANLGIELTNKTLGIFGLGRIGFELAKRCRGAYSMNVIYHNRSANKEAEKELNATLVSFDGLLAKSDVLSVHASLTPETKEAFNLNAFSKMKSSAIFINTARGGLHNEADLTKALQEGLIWGAGLDVTNPEPMLPGNPLLQIPSVAVLPHIGSSTVEARNGMAKYAAENIIAGLEGKRLPHLINEKVYQ